MDSLPIHPIIVHFPIALSAIMPLLAAGLLLAWWKGWFPRRVWIVAALFQAVLVGTSFIALQTGENDEERVEQVLASEDGIEAHEEAAEVFFFTTIGVLLLFVAGALLPGQSAARIAATLAVIGAIAVAGLGYRVGHAGGELVYRYGAANAFVKGGAQVPAAHSEREDD